MTDKITLEITEELGASIREMQISQSLAGLNLMPHMLSHLEDMAANGDEIAKAVIARFKGART